MLTSKQLPTFFVGKQRYEMLGGISRLDFGRRITADERRAWLLLEVEDEARRKIPELVGKTFKSICKDVRLPTELVDCPLALVEKDYDKTIAKLERSIEKRKNPPKKKQPVKGKGKKAKAKTTAKKTAKKKVNLKPK